MRRSIELVAIATVTLVPVWAEAQVDLSAAEAAFYAAEFDAARTAFAAALASPELDRPSAAKAHLFLATLELLLASRERASGHALAAVALDPAVQAPEGMSRVDPVLDDARRRNGRRALTLDVTHERRGDDVVVRAAIEPRVQTAVSRIALECRPTEGGGRPVERAVDTSDRFDVEIALVDGTRANQTCEATGATAHGAILLREPHAIAAVAPVVPSGDQRDLLLDEPETDPPDDDEGGAGAWPWILGGAAIVAAAAATVLLVASPGAGEADLVVELRR